MWSIVVSVFTSVAKGKLQRTERTEGPSFDAILLVLAQGFDHTLKLSECFRQNIGSNFERLILLRREQLCVRIVRWCKNFELLCVWYLG